MSDERRRLERLDRADTPAPRGEGAMPSWVGLVASTGPVSAGTIILADPVGVTGAEQEGASPTTSPDRARRTAVFFAGPGTTSQGDRLIVTWTDFRWVARKGTGTGGGGGWTILGCPCHNIPGTLYVHVDTSVTGPEILVYPDTLVRGTKPASLAQYATDPTGYYGATNFTSSDGFYRYIYWFTCTQGLYALQGLMTPDSPIGYPGRFLIMTWLIGTPGNTCAPFWLHSGYSNSTMFMAQNIRIDGTGPP